MPELPEVETIRKQLAEEVVGKSITGIWTDTPKMFLAPRSLGGVGRPSYKEILRRIKDQKITAVERRAKLLIFRLSGKENLVLHLRLTGQIFLKDPSDPPDPYHHATLRLSNGKELRFNDLRKFGYINLVESDEDLEKLVAGYGPEPFADLTEEKFGAIVKRSNRRIKDLLMDQKTISGVGNIYANEALWLSMIHPLTAASALLDGEIKGLYQAILRVLKDGLRLGGATIADEKYRNLYGERGKYEEAAKVYQKKGQPCPRCGTKVEYLKVGQRGTFVCPKEQIIKRGAHGPVRVKAVKRSESQVPLL